MMVRHAEWQDPADPELAVCIRSRFQSENLRKLLLPWWPVASVPVYVYMMAAVFLQVPLEWAVVTCFPLVVMAIVYLTTFANDQASLRIRTRIDEEPSEIPQWRVWVKLERNGETLGYDLGLLVFVDGWLTFAGGSTHFSVSRLQAEKLIAGSWWLGMRETLEVRLVDGSTVKFAALDKHPVLGPQPRSTIARYVSSPNLVDYAEGFLSDTSAPPPSNAASFPPEKAQGTVAIPSWKAAAYTALVLQLTQAAILFTFLSTADVATGVSWIALFIYIQVMLMIGLLVTYAKGFSFIRESEIGRLLLRSSRK